VVGEHMHTRALFLMELYKRGEIRWLHENFEFLSAWTPDNRNFAVEIVKTFLGCKNCKNISGFELSVGL
jgi:hypothetical protein